MLSCGRINLVQNNFVRIRKRRCKIVQKGGGARIRVRHKIDNDAVPRIKRAETGYRGFYGRRMVGVIVDNQNIFAVCRFASRNRFTAPLCTAETGKSRLQFFGYERFVPFAQGFA